MANDLFQLHRFLDAQNPIYADVAAELKAGAKRTHWMWFIFPQIVGLGRSELARFYSIASWEEAEAYLNHPILGARLRECTRLVNETEGRTIHEIFGSPDDLKFCSCMTLFELVGELHGEFAGALEKYYAGKRDAETCRLTEALRR